MGKFDNPRFDDCRRWIQKKVETKTPWDVIRLANKNSINELAEFLNRKFDEDDWPRLSTDDWYELVKETEEYENRQLSIEQAGSDGALFDPNQDNNLKIPENPRSSWQLYKNSLGWGNTEDLENATLGILRRLSIDTQSSGPIKGLVIGHVQSGKTANMEALMAMAADHGWNMFIVLSGSIENLRLQTLRRMQSDLNHEGNIVWQGIEHPSKTSPYGQRAVDLNFKSTSQNRYFTVCLKNSSRLRKLIDWIHADRASHNDMKILVIDDEADQASISNSATQLKAEEKERKGINRLIVNLVDDVHYKEEKSNGHAKSMNYIMYTATPYANFLNESKPESLYPKDFIWTLKTPRSYIGPNQIFGFPNMEDSLGLDINRIVPKEDLEKIQKIYDGNCSEIPESLQDAFCWFLCAVAVMRYQGYKKPISMLIHTSQKQNNHESLAIALNAWFERSRAKDLLEKCKKIYAVESERPSKSEWLTQFPDYEFQAEEINDYPPFSEISSEIDVLLRENFKHIKLNEDGDFEYFDGVHLVIDNCAQTITGDDYIRLAYPDPNMENYPSPAPAFVVIGGSTLSRGLTIEGLVSTFFLRGSCQADTLMQMGRWFGYRRHYELLPRVWLTSDTTDKFRFLANLEVDLRDDLKKYMSTEVRPDQYGPRLLVSPKVSWLRLTSKKHMTNAKEAEMDFSGAKPQTIVFDNDEATQRRNMVIATDFLNSLPGSPVVSKVSNSIFWENIDLETITSGLLCNGFKFCSRSRVFNEIETFIDWVKQIGSDGNLSKWTVIVGGKGDVTQSSLLDAAHWNVHGYSIGKVNRSRMVQENSKEVIPIGMLRNLKDTVADIDENTYLDFTKKNGEIKVQADSDELRKLGKKDNTPLLIVYCIDKNSTATPGSDGRVDLKAPCDIIGIYIRVPGDQISYSFCKRLTIDLPEKEEEETMETEE